MFSRFLFYKVQTNLRPWRSKTDSFSLRKKECHGNRFFVKALSEGIKLILHFERCVRLVTRPSSVRTDRALLSALLRVVLVIVVWPRCKRTRIVHFKHYSVIVSMVSKVIVPDAMQLL